MCLKYRTELTVPVSTALVKMYPRVRYKIKSPALKDRAKENSWLVLEIKPTSSSRHHNFLDTALGIEK